MHAREASVEMRVPFIDAALWAASKIPEACDLQSQGCHWEAVGDAWHYTLNNLHLGMRTAQQEERAQLPEDAVREVRDVLVKLGHQDGMWFANWHQAAPMARHVVRVMQGWQSGPLPIILPPSNIGTRFPSFTGRSVVVPSDGNMASSVNLANGYSMPILGFGTGEIRADGTTYQSVRWALELGYRHIDTAQAYANEHEVGQAIRDSGIPRAQICLVTKLSAKAEYGMARQRFEQQLATLQVDYVDVYMLHSAGNSKEDRQQAWRQLEELCDEGKIKALGVSNFNIELLKELLGFARIRPVYIQNKYSVYKPGGSAGWGGGDEALRDSSLMEFLAFERIVMTGYSMIHPGLGGDNGYMSPMEDPHVKAIALRLGRTPSQVLHRWLLQLGGAVIPRSTNYERIKENREILSFSLPETDVRLLNGIASLYKSSPGTISPKWCDDIYGVMTLPSGSGQQ